ncbi:MAG: hypothetical protein KAS72_11575 [Phycisphaerales bacterium]|nr:hypothetical protein [Phycisphaerales bacterium]
MKPYPDAHNHLLIGEVREDNDRYVALMCRSFHMGRAVNGFRDVRTGECHERLVPWMRVEVVHVLPADFDYRTAELEMDHSGDIVLADAKYKCPIVMSREPRY